jgi:hypothetical protein
MADPTVSVRRPLTRRTARIRTGFQPVNIRTGPALNRAPSNPGGDRMLTTA